MMAPRNSVSNNSLMIVNHAHHLTRRLPASLRVTSKCAVWLVAYIITNQLTVYRNFKVFEGLS